MPIERSLFLAIAATTALALNGVALTAERSMTRDQAGELRSPVAYSPESIGQGRRHYLRLCQICHGADGKALENADFEATNLTEPAYYLSGSTDGDIFFSTKEGAGFEMPAFSDKLNDQQIWEVVNFIRSIGPKDLRPQRVDGDP